MTGSFFIPRLAALLMTYLQGAFHLVFLILNMVYMPLLCTQRFLHILTLNLTELFKFKELWLTSLSVQLDINITVATNSHSST